MADRTTALVLFSGGQDSSTCLLWALHNYDYVETIGFDYGQTNRVELEARQNIFREIRRIATGVASKLSEDRVVQVPSLAQTTTSSLISGLDANRADGLPSSFVAGRNLLFFVLAASLASERGITDLIGGMSQVDFSGYPDCRADTLQALELTLRLGINPSIKLVLPLMQKNKAETWQLSSSLGGELYAELILTKSLTCYRGDLSSLHLWGYGCDKCGACALRKNGFLQWKELT